MGQAWNRAELKVNSDRKRKSDGRKPTKCMIARNAAFIGPLGASLDEIGFRPRGTRIEVRSVLGEQCRQNPPTGLIT